MKSVMMNKKIRLGLIIVCLLIMILIVFSRYRFGNYKTIENDANHYLQMDDSNITKLVENWSKNGIMALYEDETVFDNVDSYYDTILEDLIKDENGKKNSEKEIIMNFLTGTHIYKKEEIEKALNTLIYGSSSGKDTYDSIMEMPVDLYRMSTNEIDYYSGADVADIWTEVQSKRSDYETDIGTTIQSKRSDYVAP